MTQIVAVLEVTPLLVISFLIMVGFLDRFGYSRNEILPMSFVELEMYNQERERRLEQLGESDSKPEGKVVYRSKDGWGPGKVYYNGVEAEFGTPVKITDKSGKRPRGTHVVFQKKKRFYPWERISGVFPLDMGTLGMYDRTGSRPRKHMGVQIETDDLATCALVFSMDMASDIGALKGAAGRQWARIFKNEPIEALVQAGGSREVPYFTIKGDLYKPAWLRRVDGATTVSYGTMALERSAPAMEPMMRLDPLSLDDETVRQWAEYMVDHLGMTRGMASVEESSSEY